MLESWGLRAAFVRATAAGPAPEALAKLPMAERSLPQILHLAELLAGLLTENRSDLLPILLEDGSRFHHLTHTQLSTLVHELQERVEELADVLQLELPDGRDYNGVLRDAHSALSNVAAEVALDLLVNRKTDLASDSESLLGEIQTLSAAVRDVARSAQMVKTQISGTSPGRATESARASQPAPSPAEKGRSQRNAQQNDDVGDGAKSELTQIASSPALPMPASPIPTASSPTSAGVTPTATRRTGPEPIAGPHSSRPRTARSSSSTDGIQDLPATNSSAPPDRDGAQSDPSLVGILATIGSSCRQSRCPMCLLLIEVDRFSELVLTRGPQGAQRMVGLLDTFCNGLRPRDSVCRQIRDNRFAVILPDQDRQASIEFGYQVLRDIRRVGATSHGEARPTMTVSIGLAAVTLPPKNFAPQDLIDSTERCLHAARLAGGNALKSIELY